MITYGSSPKMKLWRNLQIASGLALQRGSLLVVECLFFGYYLFLEIVRGEIVNLTRKFYLAENLLWIEKYQI